MRPGHAEYQAFLRPASQSAQRESNPHFRHGKAAGCRYIMGAWLEAELSKTKSTGRDSNPRRRITGAVSLPLDDQCLWLLSVGPVGIEPTSSGLRDRCITLSATVPNQSARRELNPRPGAYKAPALTAVLNRL